jgi:RHS repeat-associated protein
VVGQFLASRSVTMKELAAHPLRPPGTRKRDQRDDATSFGFGGGYADITGMIYLVHRYYDPVTGQFVSNDPDGNSTGVPYSYSSDNPVENVDPSGLRDAYVESPIDECRGTHSAGCDQLRYVSSQVKHLWPNVEGDIPLGPWTLFFQGVSVTLSADVSITPEASKSPISAVMGTDGTVGVGIGKFTTTFSPLEAENGVTLGDETPGSSSHGLSISDDGLQATSSQSKQLDGFTVTATITATAVPSKQITPFLEAAEEFELVVERNIWLVPVVALSVALIVACIVLGGVAGA